MRFNGYGTDEEEPLHDLSGIRFASMAAEAEDCPQIVPGTLLSGYKRSPQADLWLDAEVVSKKPGKHEGGKCHCM